ncbi:MAG: YdcF family protein [Erysipelotrichaceae bacterium]|nr:YdcF family protein [Erysipelotrichaceae bacterium]
MREKRKHTKGLIAAGCLAAGAAAAGMMLYRHYLPPVQKKKEESAWPFALLLGCPNRKDGSMSTSQIMRCQTAIDAFEKGLYHVLVISGAAVRHDRVEALEMKNWIEQNSPVSIPVIVETSARNTWENFKNVSGIIQDNPVLIITSDLHARRSAATAAHFFSHYDLYTYPERRPKHIMREIPSRMIYLRLEMEKDLNRLKDSLNTFAESAAQADQNPSEQPSALPDPSDPKEQNKD